MKLKKLNVLIICLVIILSMFMSACESNAVNVENKNMVTETAQKNAFTQDEENLDNFVDENKMASETTEKYNEFVKKAEEIEKYSKENYETATTQYELNTESYNVYVKWDFLLNEVYQYLKATINSDDFSALEAEEIEWIKEKEKCVEEATVEWQGGSGEPLARNSAGIKYTRERCYYLISLIK